MANYKVEHIILFGSRAHGTQHKESDIDLAIFSSEFTPDNEIAVMADLMLRAMPYHLDIQPLVFPLEDYHSDNDFIQEEIIKRGIELTLEENS